MLSISTCAATARPASLQQLERAATGGVVRHETLQGKAVHVVPMKLMLKVPATERSKRKYDKLLPRFAFKFNLRRYIKAAELLAHGRAPEPSPWWGGAGSSDEPKLKRLEIST